ncbi:translation factor GUF1, mitochondrial [Camelus ferus]|nr:translation factor GUF1, mitochondrial [Camelus ferus]
MVDRDPGRRYSSAGRKEKIDMSRFPVENIRNFSIIAHVDHGKSTLADRLLELTGTIDKTKNNKQVLDKLQVERERGITVKAQTASLFYNWEGKQYLLNLIDTPGHVDFSYEVSRSLSACQGVLLVVDANEVGMYPVDQSEYNNLKSAVEKLTLNDSSVTVHRDNSLALGAGWRLGFLGLLHMEVFNQRLEQEYNASVILTTPTVPYKAVLSSTKLIKARRAVQKNMMFIDQNRVMLKYLFPLNEIVVDFYDSLKSLSSGYASFDYEDAGYQTAELVKMDILLNGNIVEELVTVVHKDKAHTVGKAICERLKDSLPRQLFEIAIQAAVGSKIIARET